MPKNIVKIEAQGVCSCGKWVSMQSYKIDASFDEPEGKRQVLEREHSRHLDVLKGKYTNRTTFVDDQNVTHGFDVEMVEVREIKDVDVDLHKDGLGDWLDVDISLDF
ncbi:MAG: hypothetical protein WC069_00140 [Candidatus Shapirobacteria bacterium]